MLGRRASFAVTSAVAGVSALVLAVGLSGCTSSVEIPDSPGVVDSPNAPDPVRTEAANPGAADSTDASGMTLEEVEKLSLEEQFDLVEQRDARMRVILTEAQAPISADVWRWLIKGVIPTSGLSAPGQVQGATRDNSYYVQIGRTIQLPGGVGDRADLDPMIAYFESKGWDYSITELSSGGIQLLTRTGDGYWVEYRVQLNGWYNLSVFSDMFWGDYRGLLHAIGDRVPREAFSLEQSLPGVFVDFPKWSDPLIERDPLNPYGD